MSTLKIIKKKKKKYFHSEKEVSYSYYYYNCYFKKKLPYPNLITEANQTTGPTTLLRQVDKIFLKMKDQDNRIML